MDPRVERTRQHVLNTTRTMLVELGPEAVTFSRVGKVARVARQTLYHHWQTREQLIADMLFVNRGYDNSLPTQATPEAYLQAFLLNFRDILQSPAIAGAVSVLMAQAPTDPASAEKLQQMVDQRMDSLRVGWGPVAADDFAMIIGPVMFQVLVLRQPATDEFVTAIVQETLARHSVGVLTSH